MSVEATALRVLLHARGQTSLAFGLGLAELWDRGDPAACLAAEVLTLEQRVFAAGESTRILWLRLEQIPPHQRPHYSRRAAFAILRYQDEHGLSCGEVAMLFLVDRSTIHRWKRRRERLGERIAFAPLPKPVTPCRRIDDATRELVWDAHQAGFESRRLIAGTLTRAGYKVGRTSVCRFCAKPEPAASTPRRFGPVVTEASAWLLHDESEPCAEPLRLPPRVTRAFTALRHAVGHALLHVLRSFRGPGMDQARQRREALLRDERRLLQRRAILRSRLARLPPRERPRYRPDLRVAILAFKHRCRMPNDELGRIFLLDPGTLSSWNGAADASPESQTLLRPKPPLQSAEDAVLRIVASLPRLTRQCREELIAALRRLAQQLHVRRRRTPTTSSHAVPAAELIAPRPRLAPIRARYPNHYWMADLSILARLFRIPGLPHLAVILDVYSRLVLLWKLFPSQPTSQQIADLLLAAARRHGGPRHFVSDHGEQFTGEPFRNALAKLGTEPRLGAIGQSGSIAIVERLWRTLKEILDIKERPELVLDLLARRVQRAVLWYNHLRPHISLRGATPIEIYRELRPACLHARPAPRGRPGEPSPELEVELRFMDGDYRRLPYFLRRTA